MFDAPVAKADTDVAFSFDGFHLYELESVPRHLEDDLTWERHRGDHVDGRVRPALTASYPELLDASASGHPNAGLTLAWIRSYGEPRLRFVVGGRPAFPAAGPPPDSASTRPGKGKRISLSYPPGATARRLDVSAANEALEEFTAWVRCEGQYDALWAPDETDAWTKPGSLEDCVAHLAGVAFAWLVVAEPLPTSDVDERLLRLNLSIPGLRSKANAGAAQIELQRAERRYRELTRARANGLWAVHVLVGANSPVAARRVAATLCNAGDLAGLPYALRPSATVATFSRIWVAKVPETEPEGFGAWVSPFAGTSDVLSALARPPRRELPGIRLTPPHRFDVTPEDVDTEQGSGSTGLAANSDGISEAGIILGEVLDEGLEGAGQLIVPRSTLNRHTFVCGATGSGKSQTTRGLLEQLSRRHIRWLVVEPAKAEYARMAGRLKSFCDVHGVTVVRPGKPQDPPASINPLEPEPDYPLQSHIDLVRALFLAAFEAQEPLPQVLAQALGRCYEEYGWDLVLGRPQAPFEPKFLDSDPDVPRKLRYPTLGDLQRTARNVVGEIGYGKELAADVRGFIDVRLGSLRLGTPGRFFEGGHPLDMKELLKHNVVLEIEHVANDQDKAFLIGVVLIRLVEHLRVRYGSDEGNIGLRHVTVIEEAHRLLKNGAERGPAQQSVELFAALLAEIRAYGEGVVIAEQIPGKILPDVVKNTALKIMHRLPAQDDRDMVGATMNLQPEQSEYVVSVQRGTAAVSTDGMDRPLLVRMPGDTNGRESAKEADYEPPVNRRRSDVCGDDCRVQPCTLEVMRTAQIRASEPRMVLWVEFAVAAHVMGLASPAPHGVWLDELRSVSHRRLDCALAYAVETAVDARYDRLAVFYPPADFKAHLATALRHQVTGHPSPCQSDIRWQAGPHRWDDIRVALEPHRGQSSGNPARQRRHPLSGVWAARGVDLEGDTLEEQRLSLRHFLRHAFSLDDRSLSYVAGDIEVSGLVDSCQRLSKGAQVTEHLLRHLATEHLTGRDTQIISTEVARAFAQAHVDA